MLSVCWASVGIISALALYTMVYCSFGHILEGDLRFDFFSFWTTIRRGRRFLLVQKNTLGAFSWNVYTFSVFTERAKYFCLKIAVFFLYDQRLLARSRKAINCTANEGPVRIQYKRLVPIYVLPERKLLFTKQNYNVLSPRSYTHISVRDFYISRIGLPILLQGNMWTHPGNI